MGLDIRWPIGLMFTLLGLILFISGLLTSSNPELYHRSLDINVNLWWGLVLLIFGGSMLTLAWRGSTKPVESQTPDSTRPVDQVGSRR